jgi:hypothetical protein
VALEQSIGVDTLQAHKHIEDGSNMSRPAHEVANGFDPDSNMTKSFD